ncbi:hypothetical protein C3B79_3442 [Aeromonas hydrophila]|nr:hypothetical protein C3B79_3442 [Aeromonas hydrophila]
MGHIYHDGNITKFDLNQKICGLCELEGIKLLRLIKNRSFF